MKFYRPLGSSKSICNTVWSEPLWTSICKHLENVTIILPICWQFPQKTYKLHVRAPVSSSCLGTSLLLKCINDLIISGTATTSCSTMINYLKQSLPAVVFPEGFAVSNHIHHLKREQSVSRLELDWFLTLPGLLTIPVNSSSCNLFMWTNSSGLMHLIKCLLIISWSIDHWCSWGSIQFNSTITGWSPMYRSHCCVHVCNASSMFRSTWPDYVGWENQSNKCLG